MCLILRNNPADPLSFDEVADIYSRNRDGFGAVYRSKKGWTTWRTLPRSAREAWEAYSHFAGSDAHLHWRMCTHGPVAITMAHPFTVTDRWSVLHNGVLSGLGSAVESDTAQWVRECLAPLLSHHGDAWHGDGVRWAIEAQISGSVVVVTDLTTGRTERYGRAGIEHRGRWYSNTYAWSTPRPTPTTTIAYTTEDRWSLADLYREVEEDDPYLASLLLSSEASDRAWAVELVCDSLGIEPSDVDADADNDMNEGAE